MKQHGMTLKEATGLIMSGRVLVNNIPVTKTGVPVGAKDKIRIKRKERYVSRGAHKLLTALENFGVTAEGKICMDVGSSTGGFTQMLLEHGAARVYSIDCGKNLLHYDLRKDKKVVVIEGKPIKELSKKDIDQVIDLAVMDVSFSSASNIIKYIFEEFNVKEIIVLIKPQFEYERLAPVLGLSTVFDGVVRNDQDRMKIIEHTQKEIVDFGAVVRGIIPSRIKGNKGNIEYLFYLEK
jgi:23S rRNA (cytidine1920-2'-O)/16S rRNA (cytidine1409-2'-O)-methyltransferase